MCPPCGRLHYAELQAARKPKIDPIRRAIVDVEMDHDAANGILLQRTHEKLLDLVSYVMPTPIRPANQVTGLSDEQRLEIGKMYEEGISYDSIRQRAKVSNQTIVRVARDLGLPPRNKGPRPISPESGETTSPESGEEQPVIEGEDSIPGPMAKAIERMVLPPKPEPVLHSTMLPEAGQDWEVRVRGTFTVRAVSIESVLGQMRSRYPNLRVVGIELVDQPRDS